MNEDMKDSMVVSRKRIATVSLTILCQSFQALSIGGIALLQRAKGRAKGSDLNIQQEKFLNIDLWCHL